MGFSLCVKSFSSVLTTNAFSLSNKYDLSNLKILKFDIEIEIEVCASNTLFPSVLKSN